MRRQFDFARASPRHDWAALREAVENMELESCILKFVRQMTATVICSSYRIGVSEGEYDFHLHSWLLLSTLSLLTKTGFFQ